MSPRLHKACVSLLLLLGAALLLAWVPVALLGVMAYDAGPDQPPAVPAQLIWTALAYPVVWLAALRGAVRALRTDQRPQACAWAGAPLLYAALLVAVFAALLP